MISLLLTYSYIIFIFFGTGVLTCLLLSKIRLLDVDFKGIAPDYFLIIGLISTTTFLGFYSIFFPVDWILNLILFGTVYLFVILNRGTFSDILSAYYSRLRERRNIFLVSFLTFSPLLILLVLFSVNKIQSFDTGLYHAQYIQWIERFKTPPGLVWIHNRFAFNSHFHLTSALFSFSSLNLKGLGTTSLVFYPLNSFIFLMISMRSIFSITTGILDNDLFKAALHSSFLFCCFCVFGAKIQSPLPDITVAILIFYVFFLFIENFSFSSEWTIGQVVLIFLVCLLPTYKLSSGLIVLFLIPLCWKKSPAKILPLATIGLLIVLPFFVRNIIISGYPVYALPQLDFFTVDWKFPVENVVTDNQVVKAWARIPNKNYQEVLAMPFSDWFPEWWITYGINLDRYVLQLCLISPIVMIIGFLARRKTLSGKLIIVYAILLINMAFWFVSAPDPRFAWGFLYFNFAFTIACIASAVKFKGLKYPIAIGIFYFMYESILFTNEQWYPIATREAIQAIRLYPIQIETAPVDRFREGTFDLWVPAKQDGRCYNANIPCTPYPLRRIKMRGESLANGFIYDENIK